MKMRLVAWLLSTLVHVVGLTLGEASKIKPAAGWRLVQFISRLLPLGTIDKVGATIEAPKPLNCARVLLAHCQRMILQGVWLQDQFPVFIEFLRKEWLRNLGITEGVCPYK